MAEEQILEQQVIGLGEQLSSVREAKGLSLAAVAEKLFLSKQRIIDVENDNYSSIAPVFARGYLKAYAKLLDLSVEEVLGKFNSLEIGKSAESYSYNSVITRAHRKRCKRRYAVWAINIAVILLLVALVFTWLHSSPMDLKQVGHIMKQVAVP